MNQIKNNESVNQSVGEAVDRSVLQPVYESVVTQGTLKFLHEPINMAWISE